MPTNYCRETCTFAPEFNVEENQRLPVAISINILKPSQVA